MQFTIDAPSQEFAPACTTTIELAVWQLPAAGRYSRRGLIGAASDVVGGRDVELEAVVLRIDAQRAARGRRVSARASCPR
jgi:hypothetical protein